NLKSYFRKMISRFQLTEETVIEHQQKFFSLLHAEHSSVINFVVEYLKPFLAHPEFQLHEFLDWAEGIFMRSDVKTSLKSLFIQFDKHQKQRPELVRRFVPLTADVFMIPDLQLQERASKFILKYQKKPSEELSTKLQAYKSQMMGTVANDLQPLIQEEGGYSEEEIRAVLSDQRPEQYVYSPGKVKFLNEAYAHPNNWNDILFKVGEVIGGTDPMQVEILMNAWIQYISHFPANYKEQLEPYVKQLNGAYRESSCYHHFSSVFVNMYYSPNVVYQNKDRYTNYSKWV